MNKLITVLITLLIASRLFATEHFVASIDEANNLLKKAAAGDHIILKNGTYKDAVIRFHNTNGTKEKGITLRAETPGQVFFEGNSYLAFSGDYICISGFTFRNGGKELEKRGVIEFRTSADKVANYSSVCDVAIIDYNSKLDVDNKWVSLHGTNNKVTRCLFKDKRNLGATLTVWLTPGKEARHTISYNYFNGRHNGPNADNGLESIRIGDSKTSFENAHCVVAFNLFEQCDGEVEIISNKSCHNSYLHNAFINNDGGLTLRHGNNCLVDGNYFEGGNKRLAYGVRFIGEGHVATNNHFVNLKGAPNHIFRAPVTLVTGIVNAPLNSYWQVRRAVISNNTFTDCLTPHIRVGATPKRDGAVLGPDSVIIANNLFEDNTGNRGDVYEESFPSKNVVIRNNTVTGKRLTASEAGFEVVKEGEGKKVKEKKQKAKATNAPIDFDYSKAGADWLPTDVKKAMKQTKDKHVSAKDVGPTWMN